MADTYRKRVGNRLRTVENVRKTHAGQEAKSGLNRLKDGVDKVLLHLWLPGEKMVKKSDFGLFGA